MADALDRFNIMQNRIALLCRAVAVGINRLMLRTGRHPKAAILFISGVNRHPGADQGIGLRGDIIRVLVESLPALARLLEKEHCLQSQDVGSDQGFQHIDDARMQQKTLGEFAHAMRHVDAVVEVAAFGLGGILRWRGQARYGAAPRHHIIGEFRPFARFFRRDQAANHQIAITAERPVFFHPYSIGLVRARRRFC